MSTELKLPDIGENVAGGDVVRILVNKGDTIKKDQPVLELETDKATIEVPSDQDGTVSEIKVKEGDKVKVGQVVLTLDGGAGVKTEDERPKTEAKTEDARTKTDGVPADKEKEKVVDIASRSKPAAKAAGEAELAAKPDATESTPAGKVGAAPSVRRLARELGVDITRVQGSGPGGRVGAEDVQGFVKTAMTSGGRGLSQGAPLPDFTKWGAVERKPVSNIRRKTAEHLSGAWNTIPHVTQHDKADITSFEALRKSHGPAVEKAGGKLTITAVLLKVAAAAIRKYPQFASSMDGDTIVYKQYTHIGMAVDTEYGLLVPVIRDVDRKSVTELSVELAQLSEKARAKKLSLDEMSGGVFTITNLGGIGGTSFTPIVNYPEVAILGVSRAVMEPVWAGEGDGFEARMMMPLSLSYDHRVIDGADAARFLRFVCEAVENPLLISL
ncbi:MAG TPA: 2-oxo acid dehydrogenase subunit E2 [Vicinamibacterales bacterium]|nr:2-oxo acid dehydrogenase subunit E2 [Vicinamibacterales bacterium]